MQALEGRLYSERQKGNGDTISDGKRSQRKVWGGQVPGTFGDQEVNQLALREVPSCPARI